MLAELQHSFSNRILVAFLVATAALHAALAWTHRGLKPEFAILDAAPDAREREALSFGDGEFLYRAWFLDLQNAGDTGGRLTPMRDYNYDNVLSWLRGLQALDRDAQAHAYLAAHYFVQTPNLNDARRITEFVAEDAELLPQQKWFWLLQAAVIAEDRLKDVSYALGFAKKAAAIEAPDMANWVHFFPAVLLEKMARYDEARAWVTSEVARRESSLSPEESNWANDFLRGLPENR